MNDREYDRLKKQIEDQYHADLDALERIWKLAKKQGAPTQSGGRGSLLAAVRQAVSEMHGEFTIVDVETAIKKRNANMTVRRASLSSSLLRILDDGGVEVAEKGKGRAPTKYKVTGKSG